MYIKLPVGHPFLCVLFEVPSLVQDILAYLLVQGPGVTEDMYKHVKSSESQHASDTELGVRRSGAREETRRLALAAGLVMDGRGTRALWDQIMMGRAFACSGSCSRRPQRQHDDAHAGPIECC